MSSKWETNTRTLGAIVWHGPHHEAVKSMTTNCCSFPAWMSNASKSATEDGVRIVSDDPPPRNTSSTKQEEDGFIG